MSFGDDTLDPANRYVPNGVPLTPYEREVLVILQEEAAEVIQAASKLLRFGKESRPSLDRLDGKPNVDVLAEEIGDFNTVAALAVECGLISMTHIRSGAERKTERLAYYMQTKRETAP